MKCVTKVVFSLAAGAALSSAAVVADGNQCVGQSDECVGDLGSLLQSPKKMLAGPLVCEIQSNYIVIDNRGYSRYRAQDALLGSYGPEAANTAWIPPHLSFVEPAPAAWLENNSYFGTKVRITSSQESQFNVDVSVSSIPMTDINASANASIGHNGSYFLQELKVSSALKILTWFNDPSNAATVAYYKNMDRPRIVTTVWLLIQGDIETASICGGGSVSLEINGDKASVSGSGCAKSTWSFSADSVMAYEGSQISWSKDVAMQLRADTGTR
eukprot:TRINITY_DN4783_c0_g2_i1.p1 TRINITY_DN4783_c0_g2~~TRINITY_DN4783_c0_g2_i1.p1  ORF type:complete len:295 (+),score=60.69 TRINITY_DN4783_c0_g2_i1:74-886(+)